MKKKHETCNRPKLQDSNSNTKDAAHSKEKRKKKEEKGEGGGKGNNSTIGLQAATSCELKLSCAH
jgi:hypothetical protein